MTNINRVFYVPETSYGVLMYPPDRPRRIKRRPHHNRKSWLVAYTGLFTRTSLAFAARKGTDWVDSEIFKQIRDDMVRGKVADSPPLKPSTSASFPLATPSENE